MLYTALATATAMLSLIFFIRYVWCNITLIRCWWRTVCMIWSLLTIRLSFLLTFEPQTLIVVFLFPEPWLVEKEGLAQLESYFRSKLRYCCRLLGTSHCKQADLLCSATSQPREWVLQPLVPPLATPLNSLSLELLVHFRVHTHRVSVILSIWCVFAADMHANRSTHFWLVFACHPVWFSS